jgi:hypothetical protein
MDRLPTEELSRPRRPRLARAGLPLALPLAALLLWRRAGLQRRSGAWAVRSGAWAAGAVALGSFAVGALAVGAIAVGAVAVGRVTIRDLRVQRLTVREVDLPLPELRRLSRMEISAGSRER